MSSSSTGVQGIPASAAPAGPLRLLRPLLLLFISSCYIPATVLHLILTGNFRPFFDFSAFKDVWFAKFWTFLGPRSRELAAPDVLPLIANNAYGVCLDIGPGSGEWLYLFAKAQNPKITKMYGIEPNTSMHPQLRANAAKAGLGDIYEVVGCGAQELLTKAGFQPASVDTIITVQCLCSIPTPEKVIRELVPVLKPGGRWLLFEHVQTKYQGHFVDGWSKAINTVWPHFLNGCDLRRPIDEWVAKSGHWKDVQIRPAGDYGPYDTVPHVVGTFTKA